MTVAFTLRKVLAALPSDKPKDRDQALETLKDLLAEEENLLGLDALDWRNIFEAFCSCVEKQKETFLSAKMTSTAKNRSQVATKAAKVLVELSQDFKWLCDRGATRLNQAFVRPILEHVLSALPHRGGLFEPLAPQYLRGLRNLLSIRAYRDHVPIAGWESLLKLCITVLNDDNSSDPDSMEGPAVRKVVSGEQVELSKILSLLVIGCPKSLTPYAGEILEFLAAFFQQHPDETLCHGPLVAAANHILFEASHEIVSSTIDFLASAVPCLIPLLEARGTFLKMQAMFTIRFYLYQCKVPSEDLFSRLDMESVCLRLLDGSARELRRTSNFSIGAIRSMEQFIMHIRNQAPNAAPVPGSHAGELDLNEKDLCSLVFVECGADVYNLALLLEATAPRSDAKSESEVSTFDSPRFQKRQKQTDVLSDLSRVLRAKGSSREEKVGWLQILALLFTKYSAGVSKDHFETVQSEISLLLSQGYSDLTPWVLLCQTQLLLGCKPVDLRRGGDHQELVWSLASKMATSGTTCTEAGFYVMEQMMRCNLGQPAEYLACADRVTKELQSRGQQPTMAAVMYLQAYASCSSTQSFRGSARMGSNGVIVAWLLQRSAPGFERPKLPYAEILTTVALLSGIEVVRRHPASENIVRSPLTSVRSEEMISEWRLMGSRELFHFAANELPVRRCTSKHHSRAPNSFSIPRTQKHVLIGVLRRKLLDLTELRIAQASASSMLICADIILLSLTLFRIESMVLPVSNVLPPLEDHLGSVAQTFSNGLATLSERDQQALLNYVGDGLDAICRILEAGDVFVEIRAVRLAFLQGLAASFAQVLRKALDDQDTARKQLPVLSQGLDTLQMDFYMDTTAERSMRFRTIGSAVRSLRAISEILPGTEVTLRNPHNDLVIDAIPETFLAIIYGGTEVIEYFERTSKDLTVEQCLTILDNSGALLSTYTCERNLWCSIYIIDSLSALLPSLLRYREEASIASRCKNLFAYFFKLVRARGTPGRICTSFGKLLQQYLALDPAQKLVGYCLGDEDPDAALTVCIALLGHSDYFVRNGALSTIHKLFASFHPDGHRDMFEDIRTVSTQRSDQFLHLMTGIDALVEVLIAAPTQRAAATLELLRLGTQSEHSLQLLDSAFEGAAQRFGISDEHTLLDALLPDVLWMWPSDFEKVPWQLFGYDSNASFAADNRSVLLAKLLCSGNMEATKRFLSSDNAGALEQLRKGMPTILCHLLPIVFSEDDAADSHRAKEALEHLRALYGYEQFDNMIRQCKPAVIANLLRSAVGPSAGSTLSARWPRIHAAFSAMDALASDPLPVDSTPASPRRIEYDEVLRVIQWLYGIETMNCTPSMSESDLKEYFSPVLLQKVLQNLHECFKKLVFAEDKRALMVGGYRLLLAIAAPNIAMEPFLFRSTSQALITALPYPEICVCASSMLQYLLAPASTANKSQIGTNINWLVPALAQRAAAHANAGAMESVTACKRVITSCIQSAWRIDAKKAQLAVMQLEPEGMEDVRDALSQEGYSVMAAEAARPENVLALMALSGIGESGGFARVKYLRAALETTTLTQYLTGNQHQAEILVGRLLEILNAAQPSTHLALEAGHCLGRLAPLLRGRITKRLTSTSFNQGAATHGAHSHEIGTTLALRWLCKYLFHEDVFTVGVVIRTLHALFALPEGIEAFDALSPDDAEVMVMFKPASKRPMKHVETKKEYPVLQEDLLWAPFWKNSAVEYPLSKARSVLSDLAISLLRCCPPSSFFDRLGSIFERIPEFADVMLPFVVHSALEHELAVAGKKVRKRGVPSIRETLSSRVRALVAAPEALLPGVLASMLRVVEILRMHSHPTRKTPFDDNAWLDLDFFELAKSAVWNKSYASALVFLEVAEEATRRDWVPKMPMTPVPKRRDASMLNLLLEINRHIGDADGFEGVMFCLGQEIMVDGSDALVQSYEHNYAWDRILNVRETQLKVKVTPPDVGPAVQIGLMTAMSNMGLHHLLETYIKGIYPLSEGPISNSDIRELQYQSMWRNAHWDVQSLSLQAGAPGPNQQMYDAFDAYHKDDRENLNALTSEGIQNSIKGLSGLSLQNALNPFPYLRSLTINTELCELAVSDSSLPAFDRLLKIWDWRMTNLVSMQTFSELEPVLAARTSSMRCLIEKGRGAVSSDLIRAIYLGFCKHLLTYSQISRKAGSLQISQTALAHLDGLLEHMPHDMAGSFVDLRAAAKLEALKVLWKQGDQAVATRSLKRFLDLQRRTGQNGMSNGQDSVMLCQLGQWVAETRFEPPDLILSDYFEMAAHQAVWSDDNTLREEPHFHLAKFAEAQFQEIMANDSTEQIREHISYKQKEASACEALADQSAGKDPNLVKRYLHMRDKILLQIELDRAEEDRIAADKAKYLEMSAYNYVQAMVYGKKHFEVSVFRLCALWFGNVQNRRINEVIRQNLDTIPSSVWLVLMYQLSARLTALPPAHEQDFQHVLQLLLVKVVKDHPHHGLYHIIALRNGTQMGGPTARARQAEATPTVKAAHNVLTRLRQPNCLGDLVTRVEQLSTAYIELAFKKLTSAMIKENKTQPLDGRSRFAQIAKAGIDVPVATIEHQVRDDCQYDSLPLIAGFKGTFWVPGGVNLPRVVECAGSDGKIYTQLVKGNDDLRQDAVLSKIFSIMNVLLRQNLETRKRELAIRTYKVIPLAPRAGLVEWVRNTLPIGEYLTKAHPRYSDIDWHHSDCRTRMNEQFKKGSTDSKLAMYRQIEHNFRPVMRHFFFENFKDPLDWFERRLGYTRSVAVSSMAGFVVGLGDRHAQNILIDQGTAEVVHIDLGIAFDQGKLLAVSELVPFRLTRDIVDGMGMTGVEGAFRRGCEETMKVLRKDSEVLLTILDVFRYDPLYNWKVTPLEQRRRQGFFDDDDATDIPGANGEVLDQHLRDRGQNKEAERALFIVRKKLSSSVSVECQISELIQTAMDPQNLSRMYPGWQAWM